MASPADEHQQDQISYSPSFKATSSASASVLVEFSFFSPKKVVKQIQYDLLRYSCGPATAGVVSAPRSIPWWFWGNPAVATRFPTGLPTALTSEAAKNHKAKLGMFGPDDRNPSLQETQLCFLVL